jgi:DNA-binding response OmpR family regulator
MGMDSMQVRVLIVDDNIDLAGSISRLLLHYGFSVETAPNGAQGIEIARSFQPRIVLLDIGLPDMDGYLVAQTLREELGLTSATLIAISAHYPRSLHEVGRKSRFDHFLVKPVDFELLMPLLEFASDARRPQDDCDGANEVDSGSRGVINH